MDCVPANLAGQAATKAQMKLLADIIKKTKHKKEAAFPQPLSIITQKCVYRLTTNLSVFLLSIVFTSTQ